MMTVLRNSDEFLTYSTGRESSMNSVTHQDIGDYMD